MDDGAKNGFRFQADYCILRNSQLTRYRKSKAKRKKNNAVLSFLRFISEKSVFAFILRWLLFTFIINDYHWVVGVFCVYAHNFFGLNGKMKSSLADNAKHAQKWHTQNITTTTKLNRIVFVAIFSIEVVIRWFFQHSKLNDFQFFFSSLLFNPL